MMATSLVNNLMEVDGVQVLLARDPSLPRLRPDVEEVRSRDWADAVAACDAAWIIAPESDGILLTLTKMVETSGRTLLGCRSDAVGIASSKLRTARILELSGIATIPTPDACGIIPHSSSGWIAKPDDGAGADQMIATDNLELLTGWLESRKDTHIVQPRIQGLHASATTLMNNGKAHVLSVNSQTIELTQQGCHYQGGTIGLYEQHRNAVTPIVNAIAAVLPGLWGPVGIDFILAEQGPVVVEINPRMTTLWAGLHNALGQNPARLVLELDRTMPTCRPVRTVAVEIS